MNLRAKEQIQFYELLDTETRSGMHCLGQRCSRTQNKEEMERG